MAADPRLSSAAASTAVNAITALLNTGGAGKIIFYTATIPTDADTAVGAQVALSTATFNATSFGAASTGTATANSITGSTAGASGTATWCRWINGSAATVLDATVGTSGEDFNFNTNIFVQGAAVSVSALTLALPKT